MHDAYSYVLCWTSRLSLQLLRSTNVEQDLLTSPVGLAFAIYNHPIAMSNQTKLPLNLISVMHIFVVMTVDLYYITRGNHEVTGVSSVCLSPLKSFSTYWRYTNKIIIIRLLLLSSTDIATALSVTTLPSVITGTQTQHSNYCL